MCFPSLFFLLPCTPPSCFSFFPASLSLFHLIFGPAQAPNLFLLLPSFLFSLPSFFFFFTASLFLQSSYNYFLSSFLLFVLLHGVEVVKICMNGNHPSHFSSFHFVSCPSRPLLFTAFACRSPIFTALFFFLFFFQRRTSYKHMAYAIFCLPFFVQCGTYPLLPRSQSLCPTPPSLVDCTATCRRKNRLCIKITSKTECVCALIVTSFFFFLCSQSLLYSSRFFFLPPTQGLIFLY